PSHGAVTLSADGSFSYIPATGYTGSDSFTYKANDGSLDSNVATVSITVNAVSSGPLFSDGFESGNLSKWTSSSGLVVQQQQVYSGAYAARGTSTGSGTSASKTLTTTQSNLYYR